MLDTSQGMLSRGKCRQTLWPNSSVGNSIPRIISVESLKSPSINHWEYHQVATIAVSPS